MQTHLFFSLGSTLINADEEFVNKLYGNIPNAKRVPNSKRWSIPCDSIPVVEFVISGVSFSIDANTFSPGRLSEGSEFCYGGVVANVKPHEAWIVGGIFLSNVYTIFDADARQVGFTPLKGHIGGDP